ncbi:hypothetical protein EDD18DRAFT_1367412 [Armillaria luteobubalina]|uniref:CxC2-like cysteine cluster KDZ transposase-associated domain-containing protein n=1 Tax=Armillaria luteobubalina TaxID=153913 RepID=A0AA39NZX3_9AGAR|nr:hypothetical protein EDD18DRAFT_1367412 [Armillaria luteobubalina]
MSQRGRKRIRHAIAEHYVSLSAGGWVPVRPSITRSHSTPATGVTRIHHTEFSVSHEGEAFVSHSHEDIPIVYNTIGSHSHTSNIVSLSSDDSHDPTLEDFDVSAAQELTEHILHLRSSRKKRTIEQEPLHRWAKEIDSYLAKFLHLEGRSGPHACGSCGEEACFRCASCYNGPSFCQRCIVEAHRCMPFHRIEEWTGSFYTRVSLKKLGLIVQLGHPPGETCTSPRPSGRQVVVMDIEGIHEVNVAFCGCHRALDHYVQMLRIQWFPGSVEHPRTAITFRALRHFQLLSFMSKASAYEYYHMLERLTDNTGVYRCPVFLRIVHEWRHVRMLKCHGRGNDPSGSKGTKVGDCVVHCLACPRPGVNMVPKRVKEDEWVDVLFICRDANFRLSRFNVSSILRDPRLNKGYSYFVEEEEFAKHLALHEGSMPEEANTWGAICARHECRRASSVVDLKKGEQYVYMDYALLKSLMTDMPKSVIISYDIGCQWHKNLWKQIEQYGPELALPIKPDNVIILVPKFHLPAHISECQEEFSFNLEPKVGTSDGEAPERGWAASNLVASSTKEMGPGSRRDTLDDHWGDNNWRKCVNIGISLLRNIQEAVPQREEHRVTFETFSETIAHSQGGMECLKQWTESVEAWEKRRFSKIPVPNPYVPTVKPLTLASVRLQLARDESDRDWGLPSGMTITASKMIIDGVHTEQLQYDLERESKALGPHSTDLQRAKVLEKEANLRRRIEAWMDVQRVYVPEIMGIRDQMDKDAEGDCVVAWNIDLLLPSKLLGNKVLTCDNRLYRYEWDVRRAQAAEALAGVRHKVILETYVMNHKESYGHGQRQGNKSHILLEDCRKGKANFMATYNRARDALFELAKPLDLLEGLSNTYPRLNSEDIVPLKQYKKVLQNDTGNPKQRETSGETRRQLSWLWVQAGAMENMESEELQDALRIEWCRVRARAQRWTEECILLREEMARVIRSHDHLIELWTRRAESTIEGTAGGVRAYALRQANIHREMRDYCLKLWKHVDEWLLIGHTQGNIVNEGDDDEAEDE